MQKKTKTTTKKTTPACQGIAQRSPETYEWLTATMRNGQRRIEILGWKRLARIYYANRPASKIRKAINAEARRCGYTPSTILSLNADSSRRSEP